MFLQTLALPDADVAIDRDWLEAGEATRLLATLLACVPWETHHVRLFGRDVASPRRSCWIGDPGAVYRYSGVSRLPHPWPGALLPLRTRLREQTGVAFNSVLANLYRDGRDAMGWHSDDEPELGARPVIASLSLGGERRFAMKHRHREDANCAITLPHGSLLLMQGETQRHYRHALPRTAKPVAPRVNLTFRRIGIAP